MEDCILNLLSCIKLARNNVQLLTPHLSPYLNTDSLFVHGFPSFIQQSSSEQPSAIALIIMSNPDALRSVFEDPTDLEMDDFTKPNPILRLKQLIHSLQSTRRQQCPIMALPNDPQPTPTVPTVVSKLSAPTSDNIAITPIIPTNPLFPPCLRPQRPYHLGEDITEGGRGTCFIKVEDKDDDY